MENGKTATRKESFSFKEKKVIGNSRVHL